MASSRNGSHCFRPMVLKVCFLDQWSLVNLLEMTRSLANLLEMTRSLPQTYTIRNSGDGVSDLSKMPIGDLDVC